MGLKSCAYCGRIHAKGFDCGKLPHYGRQNGTTEQKFRRSTRWTNKSIQIRKRDHYICVYCMQHDKRITTEGIEVHHIVPIHEDYDKRLDDDNLISLCREHHEAAEANMIRRDVLFAMARAQEAEASEGLTCL